MNAKTDRSTTCLTNEQFANYLHERLPEEIENQLRTHIGQCSHCQDRLEASAATAEMWHEVSELPGDAGFPAAESDAAEDHAETKALLWSAIKDKLAASEDPRFSGRIGPYDVCAILGAGSTGIVLKAFESRLNRYVAIKVLAPTLAAQGAARKRFEREGRAIAAVSHEHVVPILAVDEFAGIPYLVMQYVPGVSLLQRIETSGSLDTCEVARIGFQVASGLAAAHRQGIIHRDVKPANVILEDTVERAMVTDFGIARVVDDGTMTRSGVISGTPQYMSPEQARGEVVDPRSDLFSLGGLMYAACAARAPFRAETVFGIIHRVCETEPRPIRDINPDIAPWLVQFIEKLMCKRPEGRFQSAPEVATLLEAELAHLQNPTSYAQPTRDWLQTSSGYPRETQSTVQSEPQSARQSTSTFPKDRRSTRNRLLIALAACAAAALALPSLDRRFELGILTPPEIGRPSLTTNSRPGNDTGDDQVPTSKAKRSNGSTESTERATHFIHSYAALLPNEAPIIKWSRRSEDSSEITSTFQQRFDQALDVESGDTIRLNLEQGNVEIRQSELEHASLVILRRIHAGSQEEAEKIASYHKLNVGEDEGPTLELTMDPAFVQRDGYKRFTRLVVGLAVPVGVNVDVVTEKGDVKTEALVGDVSASTQKGDIRCGRLDGDLWARARGGQVVATEGCTGDADVMAAHGNVCIAGVDGTARLRCSDGKIYVGSNQGEVSAHATGGEIRLAAIDCKTRAHIEEGRILLDLKQAAKATCRLSAAAGDIAVRMPADAAATLTAQASKVNEPDWTQAEEDGSSPDASPLYRRQVNGGGEAIELVALQGEVKLELTEVNPNQTTGLGGSGSDYFSLGGSGSHSDRVKASESALQKTSGDPRAGAMVPIEIDAGHNIDGYTLYLPISYDQSDQSYPVIVYMQGGYGVGGPINRINDWGLPRLIRDENDLDSERNRLLLDRFIVVSPHITEGNYDDHPEVLTKILEDVAAEYRADLDRVYLTGLSRGAHASWDLPEKLPGTFAATVPIGGRPSAKDPSVFASIPTWVAHNQGDPTVDIEDASDMVESIEQATDVKFERFLVPVPSAADLEGVQHIITQPSLDRHDAWTELFCSETFYQWLLQQSRPGTP